MGDESRAGDVGNYLIEILMVDLWNIWRGNGAALGRNR